MNCDLEVKVLSELDRRDRSEPQGDRPWGRRWKKRLARLAGWRTATGSEAGPSRASGQATAKLSRSTLRLR